MFKTLTFLFIILIQIPITAFAADCHITSYVGEPIIDRISNVYFNICHLGYQTFYDPTTKTPIWVMEHVNKSNIKSGKDIRRENFQPDPQIPLNYSSTLADYHNSGYSRGHMAPFSNFSANPQMQDESFYLSNIVPQIQKCNNSGIWSTLERVVRDWAIHYDNSIYVATGPIYMNKSTRIGNNVIVPTHLYKIIYNDFKHETIAFIIPNEPLCGEKLRNYVVSQQKLEAILGIHFFPNVEYLNVQKIWQ